MEFLKAKNGDTTCTADGRFLHSNFNPTREAERFVQSITAEFTSSAVVFIGPCLPFCIPYLRLRFPHSLLIAVQFDRSFISHDSQWDYVYYIENDGDSQLFQQNLFTVLGEEKLISTVFVTWKPSEAVWPQPIKDTWLSLKECLEKAQSVLTTRNHFNKRWFRNTVHTLSETQNLVLPEKADLPVVITASGPSLENSIQYIQANRNRLILMAASSSISALLHNGIVPDCCISTDGGYWAKKHLRPYETDQRMKAVPLIISAESAVPSTVLATAPVILLKYGDSLESLLIDELGLPSLHGVRNGTVSGTAACLGTLLTRGNVYLCGLDLAPGKGFQHSEPNENDCSIYTTQSRLHTVEGAQTASRFSSGALHYYREWFGSQDTSFTARVFRLITEKDNLEPIGTLSDRLWVDCFPETRNDTSKKYANSLTVCSCTCSEKRSSLIKEYLQNVKSYISAHPDDEKCALWYSSLAIKEYVDYLRSPAQTKQEKLNAVTAAVISELQGIIDEL